MKKKNEDSFTPIDAEILLAISGKDNYLTKVVKKTKRSLTGAGYSIQHLVNKGLVEYNTEIGMIKQFRLTKKGEEVKKQITILSNLLPQQKGKKII